MAKTRLFRSSRYAHLVAYKTQKRFLARGGKLWSFCFERNATQISCQLGETFEN